jgi:nucleoid-associated protein YgaU
MTKAIALTSSGKPAGQKPGEIKTTAGAANNHATLEMHEAVPKPGKAKLGAPLGSIKFQFNPKEVTISKSAKWERKPAKGKKAGPPEFSGAEPCKMTLEMFFDSTLQHSESVVDAVEMLFSCCVATETAVKGKKPMPPLVVFKWGGIQSFPAFVTQVQAKYTRFAPNGIPIRAVCSVNLEEMPDEADKQNPTSGGKAAERVHTVITGDTLALVAFREYGDPALWRQLAAYNDVDDPMRIPEGTALLLPATDALLTQVG